MFINLESASGIHLSISERYFHSLPLVAKVYLPDYSILNTVIIDQRS